jgi:long-chain acyl-CoA synthetase
MLSGFAANSIANECMWLAREHAEYNRGFRLLDIIPPFASYGFCVSLHFGLGAGITVDMVPKFDSARFGRLVVEHRSNVVVGVPSFFEAMAEDPVMKNEDLSFLKFAVCGGDSLTYERESGINAFLNSHGSPARINAGYGMTEVGSVATVCLGEMKKTGSIGVPLVKTMVKAVDPETGKDCRYNETGEICIHSPGMMIGYWKDEELTAKTVRVHEDGLRWVHTGDLGYVTEEGFLIYQGRIKRLIVRYDGFKIYPQAVEEAITKHPAVSQCAVVRKMDENLGAIAKAYMVLSNDAAADGDPWDEVLKICADELAERSVPQAHEIIDSMPVSSTGKIDYKALEERQ